MNKKISIIIPFYNAQKYLKQCIESVINQTYKNWELILVNDGSTDHSLDVLYSYLADYRISIIDIDHIGLPSKLRNIGIEYCTGNFIMFVDSDDYLYKETLETLIEEYNKNLSDLIIFNFRKFTNKGFFINCPVDRNDNIRALKNKILNKDEIFDYAISVLDQQNKNILFTFCWGKLYNTQIIKNNNIKFNEDLYTFEDIEFNFKYLKFVNIIIYINDILYNYRIHNNLNSTTFNPDYKRFFDYIKSWNNIKLFYESFLKEKELKRKIGNVIISMTIIQLIRLTINLNKFNKDKIFKIYDEVINKIEIRKNIIYYLIYRNKGESILIPLLIFFKCKKLLLNFVLKKANKRYGVK